MYGGQGDEDGSCNKVSGEVGGEGNERALGLGLKAVPADLQGDGTLSHRLYLLLGVKP